jgi:hypothetical protein
MLRIDTHGFLRRHAEKVRIPSRDVVEEPADQCPLLTRGTGMGLTDRIGVPSIGWDADDRVLAAIEQLPKPFGAFGASREAASDADDRSALACLHR